MITYPQRIDAIVISTQHDDFDASEAVMLAKIKKDIVEILIPRVVAKLPAHIQELFTDRYYLSHKPNRNSL